MHAIGEVEATRDKVALRYGPLVYNIEQVDQDITKALGPESRLDAEWRGDLLGGVMAIKGTFSDGSPLLAIPNFARNNRGPVPPPAPAKPAVAPAAGAAAQRPAPRPPTSIVWIKEK